MACPTVVESVWCWPSWPPQSAHAWGFDAHRIIGDIAERFLTPEAKAGLKELLGEQSIGDAGCWADEVRNNPDYDWLKPMHYVNVPRDARSVDLSRDCKTGACVVAAITRFRDIAADAKRPREDRVEALKILIHMVGDIHQPLHVSYADDRGGNMITVTFLGKQTNLHRLWDTDMIDHHGAHNTWARELAERMTGSGVEKAQKSNDPMVWSNETLQITRGVYAELKADNLGQPYYDAHIGLVEQQLAVAAARLAATLNQVFAAKPPATRPGLPPRIKPNSDVPIDDTPAEHVPPNGTSK